MEIFTKLPTLILPSRMSWAAMIMIPDRAALINEVVLNF